MNIKLIVGVLLAPVLVGALAGCTQATPTPTPTAVSVDPSRVSPTDLPTPPVVKDSQGDVKDLTLGECATEAGTQKVSGSLTSTLPDTQDFLVTVSWTTASGDVMGRGFAVVQDLAPGKTESFEITADVAPGATQCVKGVEYGTIKR
ncbi:MAG: hypothetical protein QM779_09180 [Propionicimonas sp.]|uniref:hypothetical protein n=1 Tax=Propionicimonas sp. TaxID=1955623 RepID=UPI003D141029